MTWKPDYATLAQVKAYLGISDAVDDAEIASAITAASRAIDRACGRQFGNSATAVTRTYNAVWDRHRPTPAWVVVIDDLYDATGLTVTVGGVAATGYTLEPVNALADLNVYTSLVIPTSSPARPTDAVPAVAVATDKWGWATVPVTVLNACKLQTGRFKARSRALFGVAGSPQDGSELRLLERIDPDVRVMLTDYMRRAWAAL